MGTPDSSHHHLIAQLQLPCCSFSISAWNRTRGKAGNSEQCPNAVCACSVPLSLLGGLCSTPAADSLPCPVLSLSLQGPFYAGTKEAGHPAGAAPGDCQSALGEDITSPQQVWFGELEGAPMGRGLFTACLLVPLGCPAPCFCLGGCWGNTHSWTKLWALTWGWKGYPKMTVLPCKVWGDAQLCPYLPLSTWNCSLLTSE